MDIRIKTQLIAFVAIALLSGCASENSGESLFYSGEASLELVSVCPANVLTRAVVDGLDFPKDGHIGLFLFKDESATTLYGESESAYANVDYSYNEIKQKWTAVTSIKVGSASGYLYGYYPYNSTNTDITAIPVSSSLNGDDVMYASKQSSPITDATASQTSITMNHALARVVLTIRNNGYTGDAKLTQIKFAGAEIAESGTMNAVSGAVSATKAEYVTLSVPDGKQTVTKDGTLYDCLLVPSDDISERQEVALSLTIDGEEKSVTLTGDNGVVLEQGTKSTITITLSNSGITVGTVSIDDWHTVEVGDYKVTIQMDENVIAHDVLTEAYVDGDAVIVNAYSLSGKHLKCVMKDGEFCSNQSQTDELVYTFTIDGITGDDIATIGYAKEVFIPVMIDCIPVSPENSGSVKMSERYSYFEGEFITLKPMPNYEYGFVAWKDKNGKVICEDESYQIRLPASDSDFEITADFKWNLVLDGKFTVADDGCGQVRKVRFTRGNLQYTKYYGLRVEQQQYEFGNYGNAYFFWCEKVSDAIMIVPTDGSEKSKYLFTDDENFAVDGFDDIKCLALSKDEWAFLFGDSGIRKDKFKLGITVGGTNNCVVLLPDDWNTDVMSLEDFAKTTSYTSDEWRKMETYGAVCLPAAGYRCCLLIDPRYSQDYVYDLNTKGLYWSSSSAENYNSYLLEFSSSECDIKEKERYYSCAVRLVTLSD